VCFLKSALPVATGVLSAGLEVAAPLWDVLQLMEPGHGYSQVLPAWWARHDGAHERSVQRQLRVCTALQWLH
jgi:hypothetical protein